MKDSDGDAPNTGPNSGPDSYSDSGSGTEMPDVLAGLLKTQAEMTQAMIGKLIPTLPLEPADAARWSQAMRKLHATWWELESQTAEKAMDTLQSPPPAAQPSTWLAAIRAWYDQIPLARPETQKQLWQEGLDLWESVLGQYGIGPKAGTAGEDGPKLPRKDRRFADPKWREHPYFALMHQTYLMLAEQALGIADSAEGLDPRRKEQLRFATRAMIDAFSPSNFVMTNPVALERARQTGGESLVKGIEHALADIKRGQLTHTDPDAFRLGENIAATPGKVVHETPLYQLIQYTPATEKVLATPLVIFPPWINRFYILDLNPGKSFVKWAVEQGVSVFVVSWKSADASMAETTWDDYIRSQIEAIDHVRARLNVPSVHTIGYCVAGTTLAATLAVLARRGEADKVKSATFFTAQVDFEEPGDLKLFVDDSQLETIRQLSPEGYLDGRYMAVTFNMLRGQDLIWNYVVNNYLLGEDYPAFDLLHWNSDVTNLPTQWHLDYLGNLYRDNLLVVPDRLSADGTPIDLRRIETPCYIQAGREDHIAPAQSVWKMMRHVQGPATFLLAGSGHIAGVVNPPSSGKYQYWTNGKDVDSLDAFIAGATEHPGSWWPHWIAWLREQDPAEVKAAGKRKPGGRGDKTIEDAPGRYVKTR
ncbi:MAG: class I poly(R)-hydroxyalkanoic acid synthase [Novosphingobium sp.]|nr:class I poly(R)-hydroxyalkanoic acid synthase [Novosphingobium sp.]